VFLLSFRCLVTCRPVSEQRWADTADSTVGCFDEETHYVRCVCTMHSTLPAESEF
jgi:hypothetical protein